MTWLKELLQNLAVLEQMLPNLLLYGNRENVIVGQTAPLCNVWMEGSEVLIIFFLQLS